MKVIISILLLTLICGQKQIVMIQELFRHGARYPLFTNIGDKSVQYATAENSIGQLTSQGKRMHYLLGQSLYKQYWKDLFQNTPFINLYNQSKFSIKSTDVNRTIESVQSQLLGIFENLPPINITDQEVKFSLPAWPGEYPSKGGYVYTESPKFRSLPVHVEKLGTSSLNKGDYLRNYDPINCPNQNKWMDDNADSSFSQHVQKNTKIQQAIMALQKQVNNPNITFFDIYKYMDNFRCTQYLNRKGLDVFTNPNYTRTYQFIETIQTYISLFFNDKQIRATATPFFNSTINNFMNYINNKSSVQWVFNSAHDSTVMNMLRALNLTNAECVFQAFVNGNQTDTQKCVINFPIFTSNLIFELWQEIQNGKNIYTIKIRYNGEIKLIPFCDYKNECSFDRFQQWYNSFKDENYPKTCGIYSQQAQFATSAAILEFGIILVILIAYFIGYLKSKKHEQKVVKNDDDKKQSLLSEQVVRDNQLKQNDH